MAMLHTPATVLTKLRATLGLRHAVVAVGLALLALALVRTAWATDDAFTTFRVVDNVLAGHGLRWNVVERVQVYTHPLWLLALIPPSLVVGPYPAALALGAGLTTALAAWIGLRLADGPRHALLAFVAMLASTAFVDYATSGLENPLAHALLAAVAARLWTMPAAAPLRDRTVLVALAALVAVDRLDHALLVAPAVLSVVLRRPYADGVRALIVGSLPLLAWEAFAVVYYGFPFPNTAYAKLGTGVPAADSVRQGLAYLANAARWDPVTPAVIVAGLVAATVRRRPGDLVVAAGLALSLVYVVRVGGDHMAGRFLTPAFVLGLLLLVRSAPGWRTTAITVAGLVLLGALSRYPPLLTGSRLHAFDVDAHGIAAERALLYKFTGLMRGAPLETHTGGAAGIAARALGPHTVEQGMIGWYSYLAGPEVHVVDPFALADPLLSHLPAKAGPHRVGHWWRDLPEGYLAGAADGGPVDDPALQSYWEDVQAVTRGPLFSAERWRAIARLNAPGDTRVATWCAHGCSRFHEKVIGGERPFQLPDHGIAVRFAPRRLEWVDVRADPGRYVVRVYLDGAVVGEKDVVVPDSGRRRVGVPTLEADTVRLLSPTGERAWVQRLAAGPRPRAEGS